MKKSRRRPNSLTLRFRALKATLGSKTGMKGIWWWGTIILGALFMFEIFNFGTTEFGLTALCINVRLAAILAFGACIIDFAYVSACLLTPERGQDKPAAIIRYLFWGWVLIATMNVGVTWWAINIAIMNHASAGTSIIKGPVLQAAIPIFVAVLSLLTRVLIIGTLSIAGDRLFTEALTHASSTTVMRKK